MLLIRRLSRYIKPFLTSKTPNLESYIPIQIENMMILFCKAPLSESRGIGRVSKELLKQLLNMSKSSLESFSKEPNANPISIYFYSSIHYCPTTLPKPSVVIIHDVVPLLFPKLFPEHVKRLWKKRYTKIAHQAQKIITISKSSAIDISRLLDLPLEDITVIYNGVTHLPIAPKPTANLPKTFILYLGAIDYHKNLVVIFKALTDQRIHHIDFVIVGNKKEDNSINTFRLQNRVHFLGALTDAETGFVIKHALALVFPSVYEGFGLPPLEAGLLGTPSICTALLNLHSQKIKRL